MTARLTIKVVPGASQDKVVGLLGDALKIRTCAQPEIGKANKAVIALLATWLEIPVSRITICSGHTSRTKVVEVQGVSDAELANKLSQLAT